MSNRTINYFDLGAHCGTEIILFLWHINFLRKSSKLLTKQFVQAYYLF